MGRKSRPKEEILSYVLRRTTKEGDCKIWEGALNSDGYPRITFEGSNNVKVHRLVYELFYKEDIQGKIIRHSCDRPECINPKHLSTGDANDNVLDRHKRNRTHNQVTALEKRRIKLLKEIGYTIKGISEKLNMKSKRVEYILNLIKHKSRGL